MIQPVLRTTSRIERCAEMLSTLVAIDTINPMGRAYQHDEPVEREAIEIIEQLFVPYADRVTLSRQRCSAIHESLVIEWQVDSILAPALFESHIDTVPAGGWSERALTPRIDGDWLVGLGACDDKGCLTAMLIAMLELLERGVRPSRSIVLVCAGDEEYAQTGILRFLEESDAPFAYGIFGEPTRLYPVAQHKGTIRWDLTVHGKSAHTSRPELGINAISGMMDVIAELRLYQEELQARATSDVLTGPTLTVTQIAGGRTRNATPDECTISIDFRIVPGMDPLAERDAIIDHLTTLPWEITHSDVQLMTPPLDTPFDSPLSQQVLSICQKVVDPRLELQGVPYGTDAAWAGRRCPCIVLGPGDIRHAHSVDEQISLVELAKAVELYQHIMLDAFVALS